MRPGCGLKFREGWFHTRRTPPSAPTSGGIDPTAENPKASSTVQTGKGALGPGSLCELCPEGRKEGSGDEEEESECLYCYHVLRQRSERQGYTWIFQHLGPNDGFNACMRPTSEASNFSGLRSRARRRPRSTSKDFSEHRRLDDNPGSRMEMPRDRSILPCTGVSRGRRRKEQ